jgi:hypothetical protein
MEIAGKSRNTRRGGWKPDPKSMIQGVVKPRNCRHCGHHEIGIMTKSGEFLALKTGMKIIVFPDDERNDERLIKKVRGGGRKSRKL